ncbi:MAG: aspartate/glutamate racemase family protein, partial [Verrucomicrobiae bacterium]|nr:aspartate/glutamate racemase family protein [Verrucomicrobiae bacterium]
PIGVFDSGTGGLTVLEAILTLDIFHNATGAAGSDGLPDFVAETFQYLADQANMPYGHYAAVNKLDLLRENIVKCRDFLLANSYETRSGEKRPKPPVKMIVIACNTATAYGLDEVRAAGVPVVGVIHAGARAAVNRQRKHRGTIGVLATAGTVVSGCYPKTIKMLLPDAYVISQGCIGLAECIDREWHYFSATATTVRPDYKGPSLTNTGCTIQTTLMPVYNFDTTGNKLLRQFDADGRCVEIQLNDPANYVRYHLVTLLENLKHQRPPQPLNTLILGCTHYPYVRDTIAAVLKELYHCKTEGRYRYRHVLAEHVELIDPAIETAKQTYLQLRSADLHLTAHPRGRDLFFISVPNTSLPNVQLQSDGWFTHEYKYGRPAGTNKSYVKFVPFDINNVQPDTYRRIAATLPAVFERLKNAVKGLNVSP